MRYKKTFLSFEKQLYKLKDRGLKVSDDKRIPKEGVFKNIMHHKFCVIDLKTVIHGSYNWTNKIKHVGIRRQFRLTIVEN